MLKKHSILYALICTLIVHASSSSPSRFTELVVHDSRTDIPSAFVSISPTPPETTIEMRIAMTSNDMPGLEERLYAVSTPGSPEYGKHLSGEEVEAYVRPSASSISRVNAWLDSHFLLSSVKQVSSAGDWIALTIPVSKANELFNTTFTTFKETQSGEQSIQAMEYSVPVELKDDISTVEPTTSFPILGRRPTLSAVFGNKRESGNATQYGGSATCDKEVIPSCLQGLYGIPTARAVNCGNRIVVPGFGNQYANKKDLNLFLANFRKDITTPTTFDIQLISGGQNPQDPGTAGAEANLDIQYTVGLATGVPTTFISSGLNNIMGFIDVVNSLLNLQQPPLVVSISYGLNENQVSKSSATNLCNLFMQLGTRGSSVIVASGDGGVAGGQPSSTCATFVPTFPATCPFATSVGGTAGTIETASTISSGGFSNYFPTTTYQSTVVSNYIQGLGSTIDSDKFNTTGRAFPDVSAQAENIVYAYRGGKAVINGTSASAPIFSSIIALLNDGRLSAKKSPLGFLNPFLYSDAGQAALNDITSGSNPGCGTNGFPAKSGWDPVTGLGTPNYAKLEAAVAQL